MDAHVGFESWLERDVAMTLDFEATSRRVVYEMTTSRSVSI
jgi:hypothetical protein